MEPHLDRLYFKSEESTDGRARGCVTPVFPSASGNCDQPGFVFVCGERVRHTAERLIRAAARTRARQGGPAMCSVSVSDKGGREEGGGIWLCQDARALVVDKRRVVVQHERRAGRIEVAVMRLG